MRLLISLVALTLSALAALTLGLGSCSGSDPKNLTDDGYTALGRGAHESALDSFDRALARITDANDPRYFHAALGRCRALAHIDPKRAKMDFLALAAAQPNKIKPDDFSLVVGALLSKQTSDARLEAIDLLEAAKKTFPKSPQLEAISVAVISASKQARDPKALDKLKGFGYLD